jgi:hypothetical protein
MRNAGAPPTRSSPHSPATIPDDIKQDIAKTVRSIEWSVAAGGFNGGLCLFRNLTGLLTLTMLDIAAELKLGGMVYRAGADEHRDVMAFAGPILQEARSVGEEGLK